MLRLILLLFLFISCSSVKQDVGNKKSDLFDWNERSLSVMQGATTATETVINYIKPKGVAFTFSIINLENNTLVHNQNISVKKIQKKWSPWGIEEINIKGLNPNTKYQIEWLSKYKGRHFSYKRVFSTYKKNKQAENIAILSCTSAYERDIMDQAWIALAKSRPQAIFHIGDTVYADIFNFRYLNVPADERDLWESFMDSRHTLALYKMKELIPVYASWDDHDYGINNGDKNYKYKSESLQNFKSFFPLGESTAVTRGIGNSYKVKFGNQSFYFLDGRSFRDSASKKSGMHLGQKQRTWLLDELERDNSFSWLILGDQFFADYHPWESFKGYHPIEFKKFMGELKGLKQKVAFVSGDRHLYELMKVGKKTLGYETYEITISGFHSRIFPGSLEKNPNKERVEGVDNDYTFFLFKSYQKNKKTIINYELINKDSNTLKQGELAI